MLVGTGCLLPYSFEVRKGKGSDYSAHIWISNTKGREKMCGNALDFEKNESAIYFFC